MSTVQTPYVFLHDFYKHMQHASYRIFIQSMNFECGEVLNHIAPVLIEKAKKGIDVRIHADWVSDRYVHDSISFFPSLNKAKRDYAKGLRQKNKALRDQLMLAGVKVFTINKPNPLSFFVPIIGRNHKKIYIVDSTVGWIGGVNLADHAFENIDCMVKFDDPQNIESLAKEVYSEKDKNKHDQIIVLNETDKLIIDGGKRNTSLIYDSALALAQSSTKKIIFISQFLPDGPLLDCLIQKNLARVQVLIYTSPEIHSSFNRLPYRPAFLAMKKKIESHGIKIHFLTKKVHAKILSVDNEMIIIGSHNLVKLGVQLGTEEIAICSNDRDLMGEFEKFYFSQVRKNDHELFFGPHLPFFI